MRDLIKLVNITTFLELDFLFYSLSLPLYSVLRVELNCIKRLFKIFPFPWLQYKTLILFHLYNNKKKYDIILSKEITKKKKWQSCYHCSSIFKKQKDLIILSIFIKWNVLNRFHTLSITLNFNNH